MSSSHVGNEIYLKSMEMRCLNSRKTLGYLSRSWPKKNPGQTEKGTYFIHYRREGLLILAGTLVTTEQVAETMR